MQGTESKGTTFIRYIFWLLFASVTIFLREESVSSKGLNILIAIAFAVVGFGTSWIMSHRYARERQILNEPKARFRNSIANNYGFIFAMVLIIAVIRFGISYLQYRNIIPKFEYDYLTSDDQKVLVFNLLANILIISYQQFMVANAFLYNYFWRKPSKISYFFGLIMSALVLALINLPGNYPQFVLFFLLGLVYSVIYRRTRDPKMTMLVIIFSNVLGSILV